MFWWFERRGRYLRCEVQAVPAGGFELRIVHPEGTEQVERFADSADLAKRQDAMIKEITCDGWDGPHGWNV